jgi:hypothetical protein
MSVRVCLCVCVRTLLESAGKKVGLRECVWGCASVEGDESNGTESHREPHFKVESNKAVHVARPYYVRVFVLCSFVQLTNSHTHSHTHTLTHGHTHARTRTRGSSCMATSKAGSANLPTPLAVLTVHRIMTRVERQLTHFSIGLRLPQPQPRTLRETLEVSNFFIHSPDSVIPLC